MRKIVAGLFISLDGVTEAPEEWHFPYFNDEMGKAVGANMERSDALLLGRVTYDAFASYWPDKTGADDPFADYINNVPKYVVSNTLKESGMGRHDGGLGRRRRPARRVEAEAGQGHRHDRVRRDRAVAAERRAAR